MKKKILVFVLWVFIIGIIICPMLNDYFYFYEEPKRDSDDYARITDVEYKAVVVDEPDSMGKVIITERLTFDIHAASEDNLFWELWRDLPEDYVDGLKVDYVVNSVKQIYEDGTEIYYEESPILYWDDYDYISPIYGPGKWYHSEGPYDEDNAQYECVFFYVDGLYREKVVFEIEYEMRNAALRYNDCSDLYLALYSEETIEYLDSFKAEILFPNEDMPSPGNYDVFTYGTNSNDFPVTESATANPGYYTFSFELDKEQLKFRPYNQYIEFDLVSYGEDKHIFTEHAFYNDYSFDDVLDEIYEEQQAYASAPEHYRKMKTVVFIASSVCALLILIYTFRTKSRMKKKYIFHNPTTEMEYFREIPSDLDPNFAAHLVFCKHEPPKDDSSVYSAILLSLARKRYVELVEQGPNDVLIKIKKQDSENSSQMTLSDIGLNIPQDTYEPLTPCEEYYYNLIVRHATGNSILMNYFQHRVYFDYESTESFARNMQKSIVNIGIREAYFQKADYTQPKQQMLSQAKFFRITGILLITLVNIISHQTRMDLAFGAYFVLGISSLISSYYLQSQAKKYVLLTQFGEDEYAKWRGLYNYLNSENFIKERTFIELPIWEKYLVYATAFGLCEKVNKALSIRCPQTTSSPILDNSYYRSKRFHRSGRSFRSSVRSGSSYGHSSSGGGFGGGGFGYGGGGRGGGGGGGGH